MERNAYYWFGREVEFGTLLGPEETPVWCFLVGPFLAWPPNALRFLCGGGVGVRGVVVC